MKKFLGKIGKYRRLSKRGRVRVYLKVRKEQRQMDADYARHIMKNYGENIERNEYVDLEKKTLVKRIKNSLQP